MAENFITSVSKLLNEEKWTRAALNSYTVNNFKELDKIIDQTYEKKHEDEIKDLCDEHLKHTKNSIIALYIAGVISLGKQLVDDTNLIILINIFSDNHKWNIVEYLCNRILKFSENKYALRTLAECYINKNQEEGKYKTWERLIKVDFEEAEIVKQLAVKKEEDGDLEGAIEYYKKAIHRFINKKMFSNVKEIWTKLIEYSPDDIEFFFSLEKKIVKSLSTERAASLLQSLYPYFKEKQDWDTAIEILKRILKYEYKNTNARQELVHCYSEKYKNHSQLDMYIKISNLNQNWRNVHEAITDFEKHISFDQGNYVFHRSWGIGKINSIKNDIFIIDFPGKKDHKMSLKMAVKALKNLQKDHIWVLKAKMEKQELIKMIQEDLIWALKTIIKSFNNIADMKRIKKELVPSILSEGKWSKWSTEARKILKTNPMFGNHPEKIDKFMVRDKPISFEEKTFIKFKAEKNFFNRVKTILDFIKHSDPDSDYFAEMFLYFTGFAKTYSSVTAYVLSSYLLINKMVSVYPFLNPGLNYTFTDLFNQIENIEEIFNKIEDPELKKEFLLHIKRHIEDWPQIYSRLFRSYLSKYIIDELISNRQINKIAELFNDMLSHYKEYREPFVWLARNITKEPYFKKLNIKFEKILICIIHLLDITFREIDNKRDVSINRRLNKQIKDFLFKEKNLLNYLMQADEDSITRLYTLVEDVKDLNPAKKIALKQKIKERLPDFHFIGEEKKEKISRGLIVTRMGYENKQKALRDIIEVQIPNNSKEIGIALKKGDLRENAEYKAALEKQELLKSTASKLQEEMQNAQIFDESQVRTDVVAFGTKVVLTNLKDDGIEEFYILGPWESDPTRNIISYLSPLGLALSNHKIGEELKFKINENEFNFKINRIEKAEII